jgi:hypothetical protein
VREELTGKWRNLHYMELRNLYSVLNNPFFLAIRSRTMRWTLHVAHKGEVTNTFRILVGKYELRPRHKCKDNIKFELEGRGRVWSGFDLLDFRFSRRRVWRWLFSWLLHRVVWFWRHKIVDIYDELNNR